MNRSVHILLLTVLLVGSFWGGGWYSRREAGKEHELRGAGRVLYYVDPMNPTHTADKPGFAPCGMPLEPVYAEEQSAVPGSPEASSPMAPGTVKITPQKQQIIGVQAGTVAVTAETHVIRTLGRVIPDENRVYRLIATIDGWTREVKGSTTGSPVQKDQLMALVDVYKYDFYTWQQQHLIYSGRPQPPGVQQLGVQQFGVQRYDVPSGQSYQGQPYQMAQTQLPGAQPHHMGGAQPSAAQPQQMSQTQQMAQPQAHQAAAAQSQPAHVHQITPAQSGEAQAEAVAEDEAETEQPETEQAEAEQPPLQPVEMTQHSMYQAQVTQVPSAQPSRTLSTTDYYTNRARLELLNLGVGEAQLEELERTKQFGQYIEIRSPATGFVLARNIGPRQWADKGTELFKIADLSHVWIVADVFAREAPYIRPGVSARVSLPQQGEAVEATVSEVPPQFDPATRTLKVRLEAHNPENLLRPEMFVDVAFEITLPPAVTVPADAVLDSGLRKTVFVDLGNGLFEPRTVETGWRFDDRIEIVKGLQAGERIVISGNFLIDSESRMKLAAAGFYGTPQKDPVCGIEVYPNKVKAAGLTGESDGKTYYFCSEECKAQFAREHSQPRQVVAAVTPQQGPPGLEKAKPPNAMAKDPSCGMMVSESKARARGLISEREGKTLFFCSEECMEQYDMAPPAPVKKVADSKSRSSTLTHEGHRHD